MSFLCELLNKLSVTSSTTTIFTTSLLDRLVNVIVSGILSPLAEIRESFIKFLSSLFQNLNHSFTSFNICLTQITNNSNSSNNETATTAFEFVCQKFQSSGIFELLLQRLNIDSDPSVRSAALNTIQVLILSILYHEPFSLCWIFNCYDEKTITSTEIGWNFLCKIECCEEGPQNKSDTFDDSINLNLSRNETQIESFIHQSSSQQHFPLCCVQRLNDEDVEVRK